MQVNAESTHDIVKFDSLSSRLVGASAGGTTTSNGTSSNRIDGSVSATQWTPHAGLATVAEHPATSGPMGSTISIAANSTGSVVLPPAPAATEQLTTSISSLRASGNSGAAGPLDRIQQQPVHHNRSISTVSAVSSVGPSAEYDEDDLDDEWLRLIEEVNSLLTSKNKDPISNPRLGPRTALSSLFCSHEFGLPFFLPVPCHPDGISTGLASSQSSSRKATSTPNPTRMSQGCVIWCRERATVVNSLLVSTSTRNRQDCIRNAAVDMLTFRKMHAPAQA